MLKSFIDKAKEELLTPEKYSTVADGSDGKLTGQVYDMYQKILIQNNAMDFDDIIMNTIKLFDENPEVLEYYKKRFEYIMVDEYQDTNTAQYTLISMLAKEHRNLCVVGDDDQSIYRFRGADIKNILNFEKEYGDCTVIKLEQNYRSTQNILDAANYVIKNNHARKSKSLWTSLGKGEKIVYYTGEDQHEESGFIAGEIKRLIDSGDYNYKDIAVLYRVNALSQNYENAFMRFGIPYRIYGGFKFFDRKEIKDIIAYLRLIENPADDYALRRIINSPKRGIGDSTVAVMEELATFENVPIFNIAACSSGYPSLSRPSSKLMEFAALISSMMIEKDTLELPDLVEYVINKSGMLSELQKENSEDSITRTENLKEFISVAKEFIEDQKEDPDGDPTLTGFLANVALLSQLDENEGEESFVTMMTLHSAKGLEFPVVFLVGMEDGVFPSKKSFLDISDMEEERRLCYVGITRAQKKLYLTNTKSRLLYGQTSYNRESGFISEIPDELVDHKMSMLYARQHSRAGNAHGQTVTRQREYHYDDDSVSETKITQGFGRMVNNIADINKLKSPVMDLDFKPGDRVYHKKFGNGTISKVDGTNEDMKLEIIFDGNVGMRRLMAAFANLSKIEE
jgi:DNA helicase-2/ATP-dependent DNA helicase PcrA